jgi:hypothetical protein
MESIVMEGCGLALHKLEPLLCKHHLGAIIVHVKNQSGYYDISIINGINKIYWIRIRISI